MKSKARIGIIAMAVLAVLSTSVRLSPQELQNGHRQPEEFTLIDVPGGTPGTTQAFGINPQGDIVGSYVDNSRTSIHGFLLSN